MSDDIRISRDLYNLLVRDVEKIRDLRPDSAQEYPYALGECNGAASGLLSWLYVIGLPDRKTRYHRIIDLARDIAGDVSENEIERLTAILDDAVRDWDSEREERYKEEHCEP